MNMNYEQFREQFIGKPIYVIVENFSSNFASGLTEENPDLMVPWEYETLLRLADIPASPIRTEQHYKREAGQLKFVCHECGGGNHENCAGIKKHKSHCDCQHKARRKVS